MTALRANHGAVDPGRATRLDAGWPIEALWATHPTACDGDSRGGSLPADLRARLSAPLSIALRADRPTIIANFVSTLDGVVALDRIGGSSGREISGGYEPDRFVMGLLRATADAVLVGAGTVRASRTHGWAPADAYPSAARGYAAWRRQLGLTTASPTTLVVSASGSLAAEQLPQPSTTVIVVTTESGARRLAHLTRADHLEAVSLGDGRIPVERIVAFLEWRGFRLVVCEGGPGLFGELLAVRMVDEVFLTLAPQLVGRASSSGRLSLVENVALRPEDRWGRIESVMRSSDHLFLRYRLAPPSLPARQREASGRNV